jgi:MerR family transcriptional regulator, light-induced transcriptional regulator
MDLFSISDIENLSGIKAHTLRVWEQRYSLLLPKRRESKHRYYNNEDLRQILQIAHLNRNGFKISKIARMNRNICAAVAGCL